MKVKRCVNGTRNDEERILFIMSNLSRKAQKILTHLKKSKYAIFVVSAFTVCWVPWVVLGYYDFTYHQSGNLEDMARGCGDLDMETEVPCSHHLQGQACVHELMSGGLAECDVPGNHAEVCRAVQKHLHDYQVFFLSGICMLFSLLSSLINPLVHGLWYPGFRKALGFINGRYTALYPIQNMVSMVFQVQALFLAGIIHFKFNFLEMKYKFKTFYSFISLQYLILLSIEKCSSDNRIDKLGLSCAKL